MAWDAGPLLITNTPELVWYLNIQQTSIVLTIVGVKISKEQHAAWLSYDLHTKANGLIGKTRVLGVTEKSRSPAEIKYTL